MNTKSMLDEISERIDFHKRWRSVWSAFYFTSSAATVVTAALAAASAGFISDSGEGKYITAALALAATIISSLEKTLKMREKWDLHRNSHEALRILRRRMLADSEEELQFIDQLEMITQSYSLQLGALSQAPTTQETGE